MNKGGSATGFGVDATLAKPKALGIHPGVSEQSSDLVSADVEEIETSRSPSTPEASSLTAWLPPRMARILSLALPIIGGMVSQNVLNLVDTLMVASLGNNSLAAVGIASFAIFMSTAFITGLSAGVQAMSARRLGEGRATETAVPLNGGLLLAAAIAVPLSGVLLLLSEDVMRLLVTQDAVIDEGVPYLRARLVAVLAIGLNFSFRGYWNGVSLSHLYFRTLVVMHVVNIALNYVLIFGKLGLPALGTAGAGMGSAISTYVGTLVYFVLALRVARGSGFLRALPRFETLKTIVAVAGPAGLQQFLFATGMTVFFALIGRVGTAELAASNVLLNLLLVALLPAIGFGLASATLVGQALGRKQPEDARRWGWEVARIAAGVMAVFAIPAIVAPDLMLAGFLHDAGTLDLARGPLRMIACTIAIDAAGMVFMMSVQGAGETRIPLIASFVLQWLLLLPAVYVLGPVLELGLMAIWSAQVAYRMLNAAVFVAVWHAGSWAEARV